MPQHKSAAKRVRQAAKRRAQNRLHKVRLRTMIKKLREADSRDVAAEQYREVQAYLDRLATKRVIPKNQAARTKSRLQQHVEAL